MLEWLLDSWGWLAGVLLAYAAGIVTAFLSPIQPRVERWGRRLLGGTPVRVHVEDRLSVLHAGSPDAWLSHDFYWPAEPPHESPPEGIGAWQTWVRAHGGCDWEYSLVEIIFSTTTTVPVIVRPPIVGVSVTSLSDGCVLTRPASGGPDVWPEAFDLDLDTGELSYTEFSLDRPLSWVVEPGGGVKSFYIRARASSPGVHLWSAVVPLVVDGRGIDLEVTDHGSKFRTVGSETPLPNFRWFGEWTPA